MPDKREFARRAAVRVLTIARISRHRRNGRRIRFLIVALSVLSLLAVGGGAEAYDRYQYYTRDLPDPQSLTAKELAQATKIYDRNGTLLYVKQPTGGIRLGVQLSAISYHVTART